MAILGHYLTLFNRDCRGLYKGPQGTGQAEEVARVIHKFINAAEPAPTPTD